MTKHEAAERESAPSGRGTMEIRVLLSEDGRLVVKSPGSPPMRIVASPEGLPAAAGQRVAELVREALDARERSSSGIPHAPSEGFLASLKALANRRGGGG